VAVNDLYQVNAQAEVAGKNWEWGFQYQMIAGLPGADMLEELAIAFNLAFSSLFSLMTANDCAWTYTEAHSITINGEIPGSAPTILPGGSFGGASIPLNMAAKAVWLTTAPNSKFNGSTAFSGISEAGQAHGVMTGPQLTAITALLVALDSNVVGIGIGAAEFQPVIVSRFVDGVKRVPPVPFAITGSQLSTRLGNMRRRTTNARAIQA